LRARKVGIWGMYLPRMVVHHVIPSERLTKRYFRRWLYWHGISRAILCRHCGTDIENPESPVTGRRRAELAGIPWHLVLKALRSIRSWAWRSLSGDSIAAFERELWLCFFAGVVRQRWNDRRRGAEVSAGALQHP
jgi:hypothetical protein